LRLALASFHEQALSPSPDAPKGEACDGREGFFEAQFGDDDDDEDYDGNPEEEDAARAKVCTCKRRLVVVYTLVILHHLLDRTRFDLLALSYVLCANVSFSFLSSLPQILLLTTASSTRPKTRTSRICLPVSWGKNV